MTCPTPTLHEMIGGSCCAPPRPARAPSSLIAAVFARYTPLQLYRAVRAEKARRSLYEFLRQAFEHVPPGGALEDGPHLAALCDHIQWQLEEHARVAADPANAESLACPDLLVNLPPRCLKTIIVQVIAVAWAWLRWPTMRILCMSTNTRVLDDAADKFRALVQSDWYQTTFQPDWQIREDKDGVRAIGNTAGGVRTTLGWTANVVGQGADWRIIDDPDDPEDVHSELIRQGVEARWQNSIVNRKNDPRSTITTALQQRCHEDDWSSHRHQEHWVCVVIPLVAEESHPLVAPTPMPVDANNRYCPGGAERWRDRRAPGEVIHPRFTPAFVEEQRGAGEYRFAAQYQQRPASAEGGIFKKIFWRFFRLEGEQPGPHARPAGCRTDEALVVNAKAFDWIALTVDATFGKSAGADNVGLLVVGGVGARRFVMLDASRKMNYPETKAELRRLREAFPRAAITLIERKANGQALIDELVAAMPGTVGINPEGGKESRAAATAPSVEAGQWYLLEGAPWLSAFVEEWGAFPNGRHDDRVDAGTQLQIYFADKGWTSLFGAAWGGK